MEECFHQSPVTDHQSPAGGEGPGFVRGMQTRGRGVENRGGAGINLSFAFHMPQRARSKSLVRKNCCPVILLDSQNHGFVNIDVPAFSDTKPYCPIRLPNNHSAERYSQISSCHLYHHRLPYPGCDSAHHSPPSPSLRVTCLNPLS